MQLWDALTVDAGRPSRHLHCWAGRRYDASTWEEVVRDAEQMTAALQRAGVGPGVHVAAVLTNHPQAVRGLLAVWLCGGVLASLPMSARAMSRSEYAEQLATICDRLESPLLLLEERVIATLPAEIGARLGARSWESLADSGRAACAPPEQDEPAFVQYSSGSTSAPKGCVLTPRAIAAQLELVCDMLDGLPATDVGVSWLPLSHDMGMFGFLLTAWAYRSELYLSTPERFMLAPRTWFADLAEVGGHVTAGTNAALQLAARAGRGKPLGDRLQVKACIVGAERVEWDTLRLATETYGAAGFRQQSLMPAYGLAEAALAVTATPLREAPRHVVLDAVALADGALREVAPDDPAATKIVSAGVPCTGVELPEPVGEQLAEIRVRSRSLAIGYHGDARRTAERFPDATVLTGDLGFVRDGQLYPVGRLDDVISIGGRKIYAREIEHAVDLLDGVRSGSMLLERRGDGRSRLTLFVEPRSKSVDLRCLADEAASLAMAKAAVVLDECVFLSHGALPKTPSGKIQRHRCRHLIESGALRPVASVQLAGAPA
jgi:fatty-acyl-CoA synthase